jgi:ring-1,2-phenylacetyl-CoA epoxidase subunit PaaC
LVIGHRNSEWTGHGPILEEDIAFSSMAQDEIGHAQVYYAMLHELGEAEPDKLAFGRKRREFRSCAFVAMPRGDWSFSIVRQFLYDASESVRLFALSEGTLAPLAQAALKLHGEEKYHLMHGASWVRKLGRANDESRTKMQTALDLAYPAALGLFEPTGANEPLAQAGICPTEDELQARWESAVVPTLSAAGLDAPDNHNRTYGGRVGHQPEDLAQLLDNLQLVFNMDPSAKW